MEIHNGDVTLNVEVDGPESAPPLVLLHGITSTHRTWTWLLPDLVADWRVHRLDFRGHGRSDRTPDGYDHGGYVSDAAALCAAAGSPCVVVGHSLGGGTAAALAQRHPELVRAAVLEDPPLLVRPQMEGNSLLDAFRLMRESVPRFQAEGVDAATLADILAAAPSSTGPTFAELLHRDAIDAMAEGLLELDASVLDPVLEGTVRFLYDAAAGVPVPTLLVTADPASPDAVCGTAEATRLVATSPDARLEVVTGSGHLVHDGLAGRATFRDLVLDFLAAHR